MRLPATAALAALAAAACLMVSCGPMPVASQDYNPESEELGSYNQSEVDTIPMVNIEPMDNIQERRSGSQNLRIKMFYHSSVEGLETKLRNLVKQSMRAAVGFWQKALKVRRNHGTIRLSRRCQGGMSYITNKPETLCIRKCEQKTYCGQFEIPNDHLTACKGCDGRRTTCRQQNRAGRGIRGYSLVIYVTAKNTEACNGRFGRAQGGHCHLESTLDRPISGRVNFCPIGIKREDLTRLTSIAKHELAHVLAFSKQLFAYFRTPNGRPLTPRGSNGLPTKYSKYLGAKKWSKSTVRKIYRNDWKTKDGLVRRKIFMMVTPKVRQEARRHFNCPTLEGGELEDQGGDVTRLSHWEKRVFLTEGMTAAVSSDATSYTRMTLALMEDSGWYIPVYSMADDLTWGKGMGCDFATKSCGELIEKDKMLKPENYAAKKSPFCWSKDVGCLADRSAYGRCNLVKHRQPIDKIYRYFKSPGDKLGGATSLADYCPFFSTYHFRSGKDSICNKLSSQPIEKYNYAMDKFGKGSKCFQRDWANKYILNAGCYGYECRGGLLKIVSSTGQKNVCKKAGEKVEFRHSTKKSTRRGYIICPACEEICGKRNCRGSPGKK